MIPRARAAENSILATSAAGGRKLLRMEPGGDSASAPASAPADARPSAASSAEGASPAPLRPGGNVDGGEKGFIAAAKSTFLLRHLKTAELKFVAASARLITFEPSAVVYEVEQGADNCYVVRSGKFLENELHPKGGHRLKRIHEGTGTTFGSHEMIVISLRKTMVMTGEDGGSAWCIPKRVFDAKIKVSPPPAKELQEFMQSIPLLSKLNKGELQQLARAAKTVPLEAGKTLCTKGDKANSFFVLRRGGLETRVQGKDGSDSIIQMTAPMVFGESALYSDEAMRVRLATISCPQSAEVIAFPTAHVEALLGFGLQSGVENLMNQKLLDTVMVGGKQITATLSPDLKKWMAEQAEEKTLVEKEALFREGNDADHVYIIKRGFAIVSTKAGGKIAECGPGSVFGELALAGKKAKRNATVTAKEGSEELRLLCISADTVIGNADLEDWRKTIERDVIDARKEQKAEIESTEKERYEADVKSGKVAQIRAKERASKAAVAARKSSVTNLPDTVRKSIAGAPSAASVRRQSTANSSTAQTTASAAAAPPAAAPQQNTTGSPAKAAQPMKASVGRLDVSDSKVSMMPRGSRPPSGSQRASGILGSARGQLPPQGSSRSKSPRGSAPPQGSSRSKSPRGSARPKSPRGNPNRPSKPTPPKPRLSGSMPATRAPPADDEALIC